MTYEEFINRLKNASHKDFGYPEENIEFFSEGYQSFEPQAVQFIRDANRTYTGKDSSILQIDLLILKTEILKEVYQFQRIDTKALYEIAQKEGFEKAISRIPGYKRGTAAGKTAIEHIKARASGNYAEIRDQLIVRPLNYDLHIGELKKAVYRRIGDVTLVLYQIMDDSDPKNFQTSKIQKPEIDRWGMTGREEEILDAALANTARLYPAVVYDQKKRDEEDFLKGSFTREDISFPKNRIMLTTHLPINGAVTLFYPGVLPKMLKIMGGPFLAVFMNTTDVMIVDRNYAMLESLTKIAGKRTPVGEYLSDKSYLCDENGVRVNV